MALIREVKSERSFRHLSGLKVVSLNLTMCSPVVRFEKQAKRNLWSLITNRMILFLKGYVAKKYKWECTLFVESNAYDETTSLFYDWEYQWNLEFFGKNVMNALVYVRFKWKVSFPYLWKSRKLELRLVLGEYFWLKFLFSFRLKDDWDFNCRKAVRSLW